jgi:hypothetical protein
MAPKKATPNKSKAGSPSTTSIKEQEPGQSRRSKRKVTSKYFSKKDDESQQDAELDNGPGLKRKRASKPQSGVKKQRKTTEEKEQPQPDPTQYQVLKYLLSPSSLELCRPTDEAKELAKTPPQKKEDYRTYSGTALTPFEELLSAVILSRPISHTLGHRSIRTILNAPYTFTTPKAIRKAGKANAHKSMFDARTQHKEKTANEIVQLAEVVSEKFGGEDDTSLEEVREQSDHDVGKERGLLRRSIHGLGPTGLNIFFRRVQWLWTESFPFMDERTEDAAAALGLPDDAEELYDSVDAIWEELETECFEGKDEEERKRRAFVVLLERVIGAQLEKKITRVLQEAEKIAEDS